jgi:hypothetical protein
LGEGFAFTENLLEYAFSKIEHVSVYESDDMIAISLKPNRSRRIVLGSRRMRVSVQFNDEPHFVTVEIRNERADAVLPSELESVELAVP